MARGSKDTGQGQDRKALGTRQEVTLDSTGTRLAVNINSDKKDFNNILCPTLYRAALKIKVYNPTLYRSALKIILGSLLFGDLPS